MNFIVIIIINANVITHKESIKGAIENTSIDESKIKVISSKENICEYNIEMSYINIVQIIDRLDKMKEAGKIIDYNINKVDVFKELIQKLDVQ